MTEHPCGLSLAQCCGTGQCTRDGGELVMHLTADLPDRRPVIPAELSRALRDAERVLVDALAAEPSALADLITAHTVSGLPEDGAIIVAAPPPDVPEPLVPVHHLPPQVVDRGAVHPVRNLLLREGVGRALRTALRVGGVNVKRVPNLLRLHGVTIRDDAPPIVPVAQMPTKPATPQPKR